MEQFNCLLEMKDKGIIARQYIYEVGGYRYNWHKDVEIMFILSGKVEVCVEGSVYNLEEGDLMVINSNVGHASLKKDDHSIVMVLHINPIYFDLFCHEYDIVKFDCNTAYKNKDDLEFKEIKQILSSMMFSMLENNKGSKFESLGHLSMLTNHLFKYFYKDENISKTIFQLQEKLLEKTKLDFRFGIGTKAFEYSSLKESYKAAKEILNFMIKFSIKKSVSEYEKMDLEFIFLNLKKSDIENFTNRILKNFTPKEIEEFSLLMNSYEENNGSILHTSEALFMHKNTLQYKLNKIKQLSGYDPRHLKDFIVLSLAFKLQRNI